MVSKLAIFGSAGFASEVVDICDDLGVKEIVCIEKSKSASEKNDIPLLPEIEIPRLINDNYKFTIGVADPEKRRAISKRYPSLPYVNLIHSAATFGRNQKERIQSSKGMVIGAGARFMSNISLGDFAVIGVNTTIGHDSEIRDFVTVLPGANISGNVLLEQGVYVGSNATILQGAEGSPLVLGPGMIIGAGAVVTKSFQEKGVLIGVPAKYSH